MLDSIEYQSIAIDTDASPETVVAALLALPELAPVRDEDGNVQAVFRLDQVDGSFVATVPTTVDTQIVTASAAGAEAAAAAAQAAYDAAPATADDHREASASIITDKLAAIPVSRDSLPTILQELLGQASDAIPFFEQYALDPSMAAKQWTDFQALDQTTKDRLLYDAVRSIAALMRYLSGDLPVSS